MKLTKDILNCAKLAVYIFLGSAVVGVIIGYIQYGSNLEEVLLWGDRLSLIIGVFGMGIAGISFLKPSTMRPLEYQQQWEEYYAVLNLSHVILFVSLFITVYAFTFDYLIRIAL